VHSLEFILDLSCFAVLALSPVQIFHTLHLSGKLNTIETAVCCPWEYCFYV